MTRVRRIIAAAALAPVLLTGCTDWALYDVDYALGEIPALTFMRSSVGFDPYDMPRLPAEGSVPIASEFGNAPAPFTQAQLDSVAATLTNPYAGGATPEVLARGETLYQNQCSVCHGPTGAGDGSIIGPSPRASGPSPSLSPPPWRFPCSRSSVPDKGRRSPAS